MEATRFDHSTRNIPLPSENDYKRTLIEKTEMLRRRMRWKAFFFLNPTADGRHKETFGFSSKKTAPQIPALASFEIKLLKMIDSIKFRQVKCRFQQKLSSDINNIKKTEKLFVPADKTTNFYKMDPPMYKDLLDKNITKTYKKVRPGVAEYIEQEAKSVATKLRLDDRINTTAKREAFITLKDHKPNFSNNPTCRLINPAKSEIGKISKHILDRINTNVKNILNLNQWKNTKAVLSWFTNIKQKDAHSFIAFDVVDFYPSISIDLLKATLDFASQFDTITPDERHIILQAKTSLLYNSGVPWAKKSSSNLFDITMGSYDGAESCELVGAFLLHTIKREFGDTCDFGLYRDDGLGISQASPKQTESIKKKLCDIFGKHGLRITIEANKKIVNFLDVTLNLSNGHYKPFSKPGNIPLYVNMKSNHPPRIIENIPKSINRRLSEISSDKEAFDLAAPLYQKALHDSGYNHSLTFSNQPTQSPNRRRNRRRNIIWYNPPYSKNVATNVGKAFLKILGDEFPTNHILRKIFNRSTVKISYSCMPNLKQKINAHNVSILRQSQQTASTCNCRKPADCPLNGNCLKSSVVYQATVSTSDDKPAQTYVGLTENSFKTRFANHKSSFKDPKKRLSTELSKHIWQLKESNTKFQIAWKILKHASPFNPASNRCNLCLWEKFFIICRPDLATLNKRNELVTSCRHASKFILSNFKPSSVTP